MWFLRRRRKPPPVVLPSLEHVSELVDRVVTLLDQSPAPAPSQPEPPPPAQAAPAEAVEQEEPASDHRHLLFVSSPTGYRLVEREGPPPARGGLVELEGARFRSLRAGPSPLPGDGRRCVYLETEEPAGGARTTDA